MLFSITLALFQGNPNQYYRLNELPHKEIAPLPIPIPKISSYLIIALGLPIERCYIV
jgi:hypothetical protein